MTQAVQIGNLVTDLHNVLNRHYCNENDRKKEIRKMVTKIFQAGYYQGVISVEP